MRKFKYDWILDDTFFGSIFGVLCYYGCLAQYYYSLEMCAENFWVICHEFSNLLSYNR